MTNSVFACLKMALIFLLGNPSKLCFPLTGPTDGKNRKNVNFKTSRDTLKSFYSFLHNYC